MPEHVFRFLDLPAEIRNMIYMEYLHIHEPEGQKVVNKVGHVRYTFEPPVVPSASDCGRRKESRNMHLQWQDSIPYRRGLLPVWSPINTSASTYGSRKDQPPLLKVCRQIRTEALCRWLPRNLLVNLYDVLGWDASFTWGTTPAESTEERTLRLFDWLRQRESANINAIIELHVVTNCNRICYVDDIEDWRWEGPRYNWWTWKMSRSATTIKLESPICYNQHPGLQKVQNELQQKFSKRTAFDGYDLVRVGMVLQEQALHEKWSVALPQSVYRSGDVE